MSSAADVHGGPSPSLGFANPGERSETHWSPSYQFREISADTTVRNKPDVYRESFIFKRSAEFVIRTPSPEVLGK